MDKLPVNDLIENLDRELTPRYSRYYRCESSMQSSFEKGVDAGIRDARQAMIKILQDYRYKHPEISVRSGGNVAVDDKGSVLREISSGGANSTQNSGEK